MFPLPALSNLDIDRQLRGSASPLYRGVFSIDTIPTDKLLQRKQFIYVCNLSKKSEVGTHFIVVVFNRGTLIYLDPLSPQKVNRSITAQLAPKAIKTLPHPIQKRGSRGCGFYCIVLVLVFDRVLQNKPTNFIRPFSTDLNMNERICIANLNQLKK